LEVELDATRYDHFTPTPVVNLPKAEPEPVPDSFACYFVLDLNSKLVD